MMSHHGHGEHPEGYDILKQVERLLRSLPDDDQDVIDRVAEPFREILADLQEIQEEGGTPLQSVAEWFVDAHLPPELVASEGRQGLAQRVEALIEAVIEAGLVDMGGEGVVFDEVVLERPRVLGAERDGDWLDLQLADDYVAATVSLHNCLELSDLVGALDEVSQETAAVRANAKQRGRPRLVVRTEAHFWAIWPGQDGMMELVFSETETTDGNAGERRIRLVLSREDAKLLAASLRVAS
jgi:hypothetical protein